MELTGGTWNSLSDEYPSNNCADDVEGNGIDVEESGADVEEDGTADVEEDDV